ncbi:hypothetical protein [Rhodococcus sp. IEGM 1379]|uniref:hypothetical protein n=1 Tax=Rhodococcus sp. IEGM 1379 TaxID=3047086 RepID=UPI0024B654F7|nr:hypothetical protein [Rhodococcus sp. IEGM 1379]MDI9917360.1 hypothetical protein [Rhodococcus sp. IEGM 1379]
MTEQDSAFDSEAPEPDALEQAALVDPNTPGEPDLTDIPIDAAAADVVDQRREVALDEEYPPT